LPDLLLSRFLERPRPDSQGALFWAFESTGKSWRGREGIFLPPRQHAVSQPDARLYKYPQEEFPYRRLIEENARRSRLEPEFELVDTGIFNDGRYFDIFIEYAKAAPNDICIRICAINRGPDPAPLTILPTLWFRNTWSWGQEGISKPEMHLAGDNSVTVTPWGLPVYHYCCDGASEFVFTENETNNRRLFGSENKAAHVKDAFHDYIIHGKSDAVNPASSGTKASPVYRRTVAPGEASMVRLRLAESSQQEPFGSSYETMFQDRKREADDFYQALTPGLAEERAMIQRRTLAGLLWTKKFYFYPVIQWLEGDPTMPPPPHERWHGRNAFWKEMHAHDIISMPDCWEYPYFCAWDLMFHSVAFAVIDPETAKRQNLILHGERFASPSAAAARVRVGSFGCKPTHCELGDLADLLDRAWDERGKATASISSAPSISSC
jgi:hypothetical protein